MSYIAPNSDLYILKQVPLEKNHLHTARFTSRQNQETTLMSYCKTGYDFHHISYQRSGEKSIRISALADNLYDCNYMMFRNTAFGNKWFYAFIDEVKYINNNTSEIFYTIDVIQTWLFDFEVEDCYIEREHSQTDEKYENLVPEDFNVKRTRVIKRTTVDYSSGTTTILFYYVPNYNIVDNTQDHVRVLGSIDTTRKYPNGYYVVSEAIDDSSNYQGLYSYGGYLGCYVFALELPTHGTQAQLQDNVLKISSIIYFLQYINANIIAIKSVPSSLKADMISPSTNTINQDFILKDQFESNEKVYIPKNKKMYNYPYMGIVLSNHEGKQKEYFPQLFQIDSSNQNPQFEIAISILPDFSFVVYPKLYNQLNKDYENSISCDLEDNNSWSEDSYMTYYAQNHDANTTRLFASSIGMIASLMGVLGGVAVGGASLPMGAMAIAGTAANAVNSMASNIGQVMAAEQQAENAQDTYNSTFSGHTLLKAQNRFGFSIYQMGIDVDTARTIDNYFSCYGYAVKRVKKPNLYTGATSNHHWGTNLRAKWNYLKTRNCHIKPMNDGINYNDIDEIENVFNNGITFWNVETIGMSHIGDYSGLNFDNPTT